MSINNSKTPTHRIDNFAQFMGFYIAHLNWCLEDGESVAPLLAIQNKDETWVERFYENPYEHAASKAKEKFNTIPLFPGDYTLVGVDGYYTRHDKRDEALLIDAFECQSPEEKAYKLIIPYRSANSAEGLVIYQTNLFLPRNFIDTDKTLFLDNLYSGFYSHIKGFELWDNHRDRDLEPILIVDY